MDEFQLRERFEKATLSLGKDSRFLAIVEYLDLIYYMKLQEYEFKSSREALVSTGHKVCLRNLIEEIKLNMEEVETVESLY